MRKVSFEPLYAPVTSQHPGVENTRVEVTTPAVPGMPVRLASELKVPEPSTRRPVIVGTSPRFGIKYQGNFCAIGVGYGIEMRANAWRQVAADRPERTTADDRAIAKCPYLARHSGSSHSLRNPSASVGTRTSYAC